jgi:hypothetical protein
MFLYSAIKQEVPAEKNDLIRKNGYASIIGSSGVVSIVFILLFIILKNVNVKQLTLGIILIGLLVFFLSTFSISLANFILSGKGVDAIIMGIALTAVFIIVVSMIIYFIKNIELIKERIYYLDYPNSLLLICFICGAVFLSIFEVGIASNYLIIMLGIIGFLALIQVIFRVVIINQKRTEDNKLAKNTETLMVVIPYFFLIFFVVIPGVFFVIYLQNNAKLQIKDLTELEEQVEAAQTNIKETQGKINEEFSEKQMELTKLVGGQLSASNDQRIPVLNRDFLVLIQELTKEQEAEAPRIQQHRQSMESEQQRWQTGGNESLNYLYRDYKNGNLDGPEDILANVQNCFSAYVKENFGKKTIPKPTLHSSLFFWDGIIPQQPAAEKTRTFIENPGQINLENLIEKQETKINQYFSIKTYTEPDENTIIGIKLGGLHTFLRKNPAGNFGLYAQDGSLMFINCNSCIKIQINNTATLTKNSEGQNTTFEITKNADGIYFLNGTEFHNLIFERDIKTGGTKMFGSVGLDSPCVLLPEYEGFSLFTGSQETSNQLIRINEDGCIFSNENGDLKLRFVDNILMFYFNNTLVCAIEYENNNWKTLELRD